MVSEKHAEKLSKKTLFFFHWPSFCRSSHASVGTPNEQIVVMQSGGGWGTAMQEEGRGSMDPHGKALLPVGGGEDGFPEGEGASCCLVTGE